MYMRDLRKHLELKPTHLKNLIKKLEEITDKKFNDEFADTLNNCIGILREKYLNDKYRPKNKKIRRDVIKVKNAAENLYKLINNKIENEAESLLLQTVPDGFDECHNHSYHAATHSKNLIQVCDLAIGNLKKKEKGNGYNFNKVMEFIAIEVGRELAKFDVPIAATRNGILEKCLREFFYAYCGQVGDYLFNIELSEDLFSLLKTVKDKHQNSEHFVLLEFR